MKRLNQLETDPRTVNETIRKIQEVVDTTSAGATTISLPDYTTAVTFTSTEAQFAGAPVPATNDGYALGSTSLKWSDLFLASGSVINFNSGDVTLTHSSNLLSLAGGDLNLAGHLIPNADITYDIGTSSVGVRNIYVGTSGDAFDDYDEGTFNPTLTTTGTNFTSVTYESAREGHYTKIGDRVFVSIFMGTDAVTVGSATGSVIIGGLPFACSGANALAIGWTANWSGEEPRGAAIDNGNSTIGLYYWADVNASASSTAVADVGTGSGANRTQLAGQYRTS